MKPSFRALCAVICASLSFFTSPGFCAAHYKGLDLSSLPAAVQREVKAQCKEGKIASITESSDENAPGYDVEIRKDGQEHSMTICEDGSLSRIQVNLEETPNAARQTIQNELGKGTLAQIDKYPSEDGATYDVEMTKNGRDRRFQVDDDGELLEVEVFLEELPSSVRKTIQNRVSSGRLESIYKVTEDDETTYEVSMTRHRRELPFSVSLEGKLIDATLLLEETPAPVQKTVRAKLGDAYLEEIDASYEKGTVSYTVSITRGDDTETFEVSVEGKIAEPIETPENATKTRV
jgi:uncharacterized membrane protein YkoI